MFHRTRGLSLASIHKTVKVLAILFLAVGITVAAHVASATAVAATHIVINEFEQNPPGSDYKRQWVELYNPTVNKVTLSDWKLITAYGKYHNFPTGDSIDQGSYYCITFPTVLMEHMNEKLTLKDAAGNVVDDTGAKKSDVRIPDDSFCWARYPNGKDTDAEADWVFQSGTKYSSNGGESISKPTLAPSQSPPRFTSTVTISGTINPPHYAFVTLQTRKAGGTWTDLSVVTADQDGKYSYSLWKPGSPGQFEARAILWNVGPGGTGTSDSASISIEKASSYMTPLVATPAKVEKGGQVSVIGAVWSEIPLAGETTVKLSYMMPNGTTLTRNVNTQSHGWFNDTITADAAGKWNVTGSWPGDGDRKGANSPPPPAPFFVEEPPKERERPALEPLMIILIVMLVVPVAIVVAIAATVRTRRRPPVSPPPTPVTLRAPAVKICPTCRGPLIYARPYRRWYCTRCLKYV